MTEKEEIEFGMAMFDPITSLMRTMAKKGGPDAEDMRKAQEGSDLWAEKGPELLGKGNNVGELIELLEKGDACAEELVKLLDLFVYVVAVRSFCPGGILVLGVLWDGNKYMNTSSKRKGDV